MENTIEAQRSAVVRKIKKKKKREQSRKKHGVLEFFLSFFATLLAFLLVALFVIYGPIDNFRQWWITAAMVTGQHQWLATMLYDSKTINAVLAENQVIEPATTTNPDAIQVSGKVKDNATALPTEYDEEHIIDGVGFTRIRGTSGSSSYKGWIVKIYDPSRVYMGLSNKFNSSGERISHMVQRLGAYVGINAGGFEDPGGHGDGGTPNALLISNGKLYHAPGSGLSTHSILGLDAGNRLSLQKLSTAKCTLSTGLKGLKTAVEWSPFLIMDGKLSSLTQYSGGSAQPRTAIGQTKSGVLIFIVIDGRGSGGSWGARYKDLQELMVKNDAYEASTLDGGSSSEVVFNGRVINNPSSPIGERYLPNAFLVNHTSSWTGERVEDVPSSEIGYSK